jgi:ribonucleoside-diphosphate reductase alpha chain
MKGIKISRHFVPEGQHAESQLEWSRRDAKIGSPGGDLVFEMKNVEAPESWGQLAVDIAASKYFRKTGVAIDSKNDKNSPKASRNSAGGNSLQQASRTSAESGSQLQAETSVRQLVHRVVHTIRNSGVAQGYFADESSAAAFEEDLKHLLLNQKAAFNSPVWFNCGIYQEYKITGTGGQYHYNPVTEKTELTKNAYENPQCSACFIQSVDDDLMDIFELAKKEAKLFKYGSGSGTNFSKIRGRQEKIDGGATSSGLMTFLEVLDRGAAATKSGGTTRRAAKMVCLDLDHPEIFEFVSWKVKEEKKAMALIGAGYSSDFNGEAYRTVSGQNSNNSVRIPDRFFKAVESDGDWQTIARTTGKVIDTMKAKNLWNTICESAWNCADPGVQFSDIIESWNTCPETAPIRASNPCSEYLFVDDSACNLASINLAKFFEYKNSSWQFDINSYRLAVRLVFLAQEILIDFASYPSQEIARNSQALRPLGIGFANLGGLLTRMGIAYDSSLARDWASSLTAMMTGVAFELSAQLAESRGAFEQFQKNKIPMMRVFNRHHASVKNINWTIADLKAACVSAWTSAAALGAKYGFRNAQISAIAPTGTIGLLMGCDTTGIEPEFSHSKVKKLAGGGTLLIFSESFESGLKTLGYNKTQVEMISNYLALNGHLEGAPDLKPEHLAVFDCAVSSGSSRRSISPDGHLQMLAAVQPFVSGGISKTVNLNETATVDDIKSVYLKSWRLGLKSVAIYRNHSKGSQPLNAAKPNSSKSTAFAVGGSAGENFERKIEPTLLDQVPELNSFQSCPICASSTVLKAGCYICENCGHSLGCA